MAVPGVFSLSLFSVQVKRVGSRGTTIIIKWTFYFCLRNTREQVNYSCKELSRQASHITSQNTVVLVDLPHVQKEMLWCHYIGEVFLISVTSRKGSFSKSYTHQTYCRCDRSSSGASVRSCPRRSVCSCPRRTSSSEKQGKMGLRQSVVSQPVIRQCRSSTPRFN